MPTKLYFQSSGRNAYAFKLRGSPTPSCCTVSAHIATVLPLRDTCYKTSHSVETRIVSSAS